MLTTAQASEIASQYGSYQRAGDPNAIFYTLHANDARPISESHRQQLADYTFDRIKGLIEDGEEDGEDVRELRALWDFFTSCELRP